MKNQRGFTLTELLLCVALLAMVGVGCGMLWVVIHFVAKFW